MFFEAARVVSKIDSSLKPNPHKQIEPSLACPKLWYALYHTISYVSWSLFEGVLNLSLNLSCHKCALTYAFQSVTNKVQPVLTRSRIWLCDQNIDVYVSFRSYKGEIQPFPLLKYFHWKFWKIWIPFCILKESGNYC